MTYINGENFDSFMRPMVPYPEQVDVKRILASDPVLRGFRDHLTEAGRPLSDIALRIFVLESCGIIAYDQLDLCFEDSNDPMSWDLNESFTSKLNEITDFRDPDLVKSVFIVSYLNGKPDRFN